MSIGDNSRIREGGVSINNELSLIPILFWRTVRTAALSPEVVS
jgi:hypothetical protein